GGDTRCLTLGFRRQAGEFFDRGGSIRLSQRLHFGGNFVAGTFGPASPLSFSTAGRHSISFDFLSGAARSCAIHAAVSETDSLCTGAPGRRTRSAEILAVGLPWPRSRRELA